MLTHRVEGASDGLDDGDAVLSRIQDRLKRSAVWHPQICEMTEQLVQAASHSPALSFTALPLEVRRERGRLQLQQAGQQASELTTFAPTQPVERLCYEPAVADLCGDALPR
eukprot:3032880-Prymnesium_polylepis.1